MSGAVEGVALLEALIPKLRAMVDSGHRTLGGGTVSYNGRSSIWGNEPIMKLANPDGPEVAAAIERFIASLTTSPARSYADGEWVLVPREITQAMLDATCATDADDAAMRNTWSELIRTGASPSDAQTHGKWHVMLLGLVNAIHRDRGVKTQAIGIQASYDQALAAIRLLSQGGKA